MGTYSTTHVFYGLALACQFDDDTDNDDSNDIRVYHQQDHHHDPHQVDESKCSERADRDLTMTRRVTAVKVTEQEDQ